MAKHGKRDQREENRGMLNKAMRKMAKAKPDSESARELKRQDINRWKKDR